MASQEVCRSFATRGKCKFGDSCKFQHVACPPPTLDPDILAATGEGGGPGGCGAREIKKEAVAGKWDVSWQVSGLPECAEADVEGAFQMAMPLPPGLRFVASLHARGGNATAPYAFIAVHGTGSWRKIVGSDEADARMLSSGVTVRGKHCLVRRRKSSRRDRLVALEKANEQKEAARRKAAARRPAWSHNMLERFPQRASTLDKVAKVGELPKELIDLVDIYLGSALPREAALAMRLVWERHPAALRVKVTSVSHHAPPPQPVFGVDCILQIACISGRALGRALLFDAPPDNVCSPDRLQHEPPPHCLDRLAGAVGDGGNIPSD